MKIKAECLNCGSEVISEVEIDKLGTYMVCPECGGSFDVDLPELDNNFLVTIIDNIEDWLDEKGVRIPNEERDKECGIAETPQDEAHIWGEDFDWIMEMIRDVCARYGIVVEDKWG